MTHPQHDDEVVTIGDTLQVRQLDDAEVRGMEPEAVFALEPLRDDCIVAAARAKAHYLPSFPGWELYSKIIRGDSCFDRRLAAWAIGVTRGFVRARRIAIGQPFGTCRPTNDWHTQAALDALAIVIVGQVPPLPEGFFQVWAGSGEYCRVRDGVAAMMLYGLKLYAAELHYHYGKVKQENFEAELRVLHLE